MSSVPTRASHNGNGEVQPVVTNVPRMRERSVTKSVVAGKSFWRAARRGVWGLDGD